MSEWGTWRNCQIGNFSHINFPTLFLAEYFCEMSKSTRLDYFVRIFADKRRNSRNASVEIWPKNDILEKKFPLHCEMKCFGLLMSKLCKRLCQNIGKSGHADSRQRVKDELKLFKLT